MTEEEKGRVARGTVEGIEEGRWMWEGVKTRDIVITLEWYSKEGEGSLDFPLDHVGGALEEITGNRWEGEGKMSFSSVLNVHRSLRRITRRRGDGRGEGFRGIVWKANVR